MRATPIPPSVPRRVAWIAVVLGAALLAGCQPQRHAASGDQVAVPPPSPSAAPDSAIAADSAARAADDSLVALERASAPGRRGYLEACAMCHGVFGAGDGPLADDLRRRGSHGPKRLDDSTRDAALGREGVTAAILAGTAHARTSLMPPWAPVTDTTLAGAIADFVLRLPALDSLSAAAVRHALATPAGAPDRGRALYAVQCAVCHGPEGRGDGRLEETLWATHHVRPRDLTDHAYFATRSDADLYTVLSLGGGHNGRSIYMPAWNYSFTADRIRDLIAVVRAFSHTAPAPSSWRAPEPRPRAKRAVAGTRGA